MNSNRKIIVSGNIIEELVFGTNYSFDYENPKRKSSGKPISPQKSKEHRAQTLLRTKSKIKRLIHTNNHFFSKLLGKKYNPAFLTMTSRENITDLDYFNREFSKFIQRLNYICTSRKESFLKYLVVIEFQKRGAIHYHVVFFNLPYLTNLYDKLKSIWEFGSINHKTIKQVSDIANYITKYITKDIDDSRLIGRKSYFTSRGLFKPKEIKRQINAENISWMISGDYLEVEQNIKHEYYKNIKYKKYKLPNDHPLLSEINGI